jgi:hypothetical protein
VISEKGGQKIETPYNLVKVVSMEGGDLHDKPQTYVSPSCPRENNVACMLAASYSELIHLTRPAQSVLFIRAVVSRNGPPPAYVLVGILVRMNLANVSTVSSPDLKLSRESSTMRDCVETNGRAGLAA